MCASGKNWCETKDLSHLCPQSDSGRVYYFKLHLEEKVNYHNTVQLFHLSMNNILLHTSDQPGLQKVISEDICNAT